MKNKILEFFIDNFCIRNINNVIKAKKYIINKGNVKIKHNKIWAKAFKKFINIGSETSIDVCKQFYKIDLKKIKESKAIEKLGIYDPIVICMIKDDYLRIQMFMNYYRRMGIKLFAIIDDYSQDGTREYLMKQEDVDLFECSEPYTTNVRQARINRIIDLYGFNRWYLIVDSDELFSYCNSEKKKIDEYISELKDNIVKSVMVDMYPKDNLFKKIDKFNEIELKYKYYDNCYYYKKTLKGIFVYGGNRSKIFDDNKNQIEFTTSKNSLLLFKPGMIMSNSHGIFPYYNNNNRATTVLRHYKFLYSDINKFEERVKRKNFANNSQEYLSYLNKYKEKQKITLFNENSIEWIDSSNVKKIIDNIGEKHELKK